ncbi:MAG: TSUP family transporter, partial [Lachnospiraceae bacterium]|nr:TSUP family transporter [Lachnospiraceae bacterium]
PDTSRENTAGKGEKLDWKGVAISLFFGLTIGFGTGFVGTGGGMMMLVVFTAFLGMELKTAVGTSTFIMTFTALIASVSHIIIHPAIILERWDVLLICIVVATVASLVSAQFANRVKNRTVGLVTGAVLTVLGAAMLILNYWPILSKIAIIAAILRCFVKFIMYIVPCVVILLVIRFFTKVPQFVFRKLLHLVAFGCTTFMIIIAESWQAAALTSCLIAVLIYPLLAMFEKENWYNSLFVQKNPGEIKKSLLMLFFMFAAATVLGWGIFGKPYDTATAILMWGTGDAAAALVGIPFGKHKVRLKFTDGKKSWEGTAAMFLVSLICGLSVFILYCHFPFWKSLLPIFAGAIVGAATETCSPSEYDTVTVPVAILAVLLLFSA